jgi:uncharacterized protein (UPF0264 family)
MRLLVSVRDEAEALLAAESGADFIDLKEPREGALGGLPLPAILAIVKTLREDGVSLPVSATIGDLAMHEQAAIAERVKAVGACGVDYVKVGIEPAPNAVAVLDLLAGCGQTVVPVFIVDRGVDFGLVAHACKLNFPALMADTADKGAGSLFDGTAALDLHRFVETVRRAGKLVGLAGALRAAQLPGLLQLAPDFAGFRTAVCRGDRGSALDGERVRALADRLHEARLVPA